MTLETAPIVSNKQWEHHFGIFTVFDLSNFKNFRTVFIEALDDGAKKAYLALYFFLKNFSIWSSLLLSTFRSVYAHQIEKVGANLRKMMPWISKNALVDKTKNWLQSITK